MLGSELIHVSKSGLWWRQTMNKKGNVSIGKSYQFIVVSKRLAVMFMIYVAMAVLGQAVQRLINPGLVVISQCGD